MRFWKTGIALATASVFSPALLIAASVGFYAGTFDPPTQAEMGLVRCALGDTSFNQQCAQIGAPLSRIVVSVNESSDQDTFASARERALMVKQALQKYDDRVEIVTAAGNREDIVRALLRDGNIEQLVRFIDVDSYRMKSFAAVTQDPKLLWAVFSQGNPPPPMDPKTLPPNVKLLAEVEPPKGSSTNEVRTPLQAGRTTAVFTDAGVKQVIDKLSLYQEVGEDLATLQKLLFEESWSGFLKDLKSACPSVLNLQACDELASQWETVSIINADQINPTDRKDTSGNFLIYKRAQSEDRWAEKFTDTALRSLQGSASYEKLRSVAEHISSKMSQGYPAGKLFHLRKISVQIKRPSREPPKVSQKPVACSAPAGKYNMDIVQYTADRFPKAFAVFLREQFPTRSILPSDLYAHNQTVEDAYAFHKRDGYSTFYFLQTRRGQLHRNIYLAVRAKPHSYRVVFTNLRGLDQEADVYCQIYHSSTFSSMRAVQSKRELPLFVFNPNGISLKLNARDWLLFGFKGKWEKVVLEKNWQRHPLVKEGLDIDLFIHPTIKQRLVIARNVYGDDANIILNTFYKKGIRQVVYLGTAGAIVDYKVGDVVTPNEFIDSNNVSMPFPQNLAHLYRTELSNQITVHDQTRHGRVPTIYHETLALLLNWKAKSIAAMDVEGFYLAKFARSHADLKMAALFVISDQTLGASTIEDSEARLDVIDESVYKLVTFFLPKVSSPQ
jgi:phosphopantetheine adenylyltransferase